MTHWDPSIYKSGVPGGWSKVHTPAFWVLLFFLNAQGRKVARRWGFYRYNYHATLLVSVLVIVGLVVSQLHYRFRIAYD